MYYTVLYTILGLLGGPVPDGAADGGALAHHLLPRDHLPRLLLPRQPHPRHRGHELRRTPEEGRGGGGGGCSGRRSSSGK